MQICQNIDKLRRQISQWRTDNETIAFVPTMGNLHEGHLSLVEIARQKASRVVVSIYVNHLENTQDMGSSVSTGGGRISSTLYGYRYGRLAYVVFEEEEGTLKSKVQGSYDRHHREVKFNKPDGEIVHLPNAIQLYEFIDGQFGQSPVRVTRADFEAFMDSSPDQYSIDSLLKFVQGQAKGT